MKKEISYKELQKFDNFATSYLIRTGYFVPAQLQTKDSPMKPGFFTEKKATKLVANLKNLIKQANDHFDVYKEKQTELYVDNCAVDEQTKAILLDERGGYKFTKEGQKKLIKDLKELNNSKVEINIRITEGEWELSDEEAEAFSGLAIPEVKSEKVD